MVPQGNGVRSALLQALVAGRGANAGGPIQRIGSRLGGGVPQQARLHALMARIQGGSPGPAHSMHQTGGNNDPLSTALGHTRTPETPPASMIDPAGSRPELENSRSFAGGPGPHNPDIAPIMDLLSGVNPEHFPALLQHISQLLSGVGAGGVTAPPDPAQEPTDVRNGFRNTPPTPPIPADVRLGFRRPSPVGY